MLCTTKMKSECKEADSTIKAKRYYSVANEYIYGQWCMFRQSKVCCKTTLKSQLLFKSLEVFIRKRVFVHAYNKWGKFNSSFLALNLPLV